MPPSSGLVGTLAVAITLAAHPMVDGNTMTAVSSGHSTATSHLCLIFQKAKRILQSKAGAGLDPVLADSRLAV